MFQIVFALRLVSMDMDVDLMRCLQYYQLILVNQ